MSWIAGLASMGAYFGAGYFGFCGVAGGVKSRRNAGSGGQLQALALELDLEQARERDRQREEEEIMLLLALEDLL